MIGREGRALAPAPLFGFCPLILIGGTNVTNVLNYKGMVF